MAVIKANPEVVFAFNEAYWVEQGASPVTTGAKAVSVITFHSLPTHFATLELTWGTYYLPYVINPNQANAPLSMLTPPLTGQSIAQYIDMIIPELRANPVIDTMFSLTRNGANELHMEAKQPGLGYELETLPQGVDSNGNANGALNFRSIQNVIPGGENSYQKVEQALELWVEPEFNTGIYERVAIDKSVANEAGLISWDISEYLQAYLSGFDYPSRGFTGIQPCNAIMRKYRIFFHSFGFYAHDQVTTHTALKASIREDDFTTYEDLLNTLILPTKPFLSWRPTERLVTVEQPEHLYYLMWRERDATSQAVIGGGFQIVPDPTQVKCRAHYTDGTSEDFTLHEENESALYQVVHFACGYQVIEPWLDAAKTLEYWEVWVIHQHQPGQPGQDMVLIASPVSFRLVPSEMNDRFFLYENSWGCFDTLRTNGVQTQTGNITSRSIRHLRPYGALPEETGLHKTALPVELEYETAAVLYEQEELQALQDFVRSRKIFRVDSGRYLEIELPDGESLLAEDDNYAPVLEFKYNEVHRHKGYSNL